MKIKKKDHPGLVFDGSTGQVLSEQPAKPPATDIPSIVEDYVLLVGKAVAQLSGQSELSSAEINAIASVGRAVAMLQAVQTAKIHQVGGKTVSQMTTAEMKRALAGKIEGLEDE